MKQAHYFGTLSMVRAFAPILAGHGGGAILNVCSVVSWLSFDGANAYSAAKSAEWSLTNGIRLELAGQGTLVTALHVGAVDTDMMAGFDVDKSDPADVVRAALDGIEPVPLRSSPTAPLPRSRPGCLPTRACSIPRRRAPHKRR